MADRKRLLIVDDDQDLVQLLKMDLEHLGYEVSTSNNGRQALELIKERRFDLLLLDIMMPEASGYSVANAVAASKNAHSPRIIVMTCRDARREAGVALLSGVSAMIQKPFPMEALHRKIAEVLA